MQKGKSETSHSGYCYVFMRLGLRERNRVSISTPRVNCWKGSFPVILLPLNQRTENELENPVRISTIPHQKSMEPSIWRLSLAPLAHVPQYWGSIINESVIRIWGPHLPPAPFPQFGIGTALLALFFPKVVHGSSYLPSYPVVELLQMINSIALLLPLRA